MKKQPENRLGQSDKGCIQTVEGKGFTDIEGDMPYGIIHDDHLGTPMVMTNESGQNVWTGEFMPFGESLSVTGSITNNIRFPGQYFDSETGLHQNWHRDYKPEMGRYVEADPILQPMITKTIKSGCSKSTTTWRVPLLIEPTHKLQRTLYIKEI